MSGAAHKMLAWSTSCSRGRGKDFFCSVLTCDDAVVLEKFHRQKGNAIKVLHVLGSAAKQGAKLTVHGIVFELVPIER